MNNQQIVYLIQERYGYKNIEITRLQERATRIVAKIDHAAGSVIAKINIDTTAFVRIKRDLYFWDYLATYGLNVPRLHRTSNQQTHVETANGLLYLIDFIPGSVPRQETDFCAKAGALLGQLHALPSGDYPYCESFTIADELPYIRSGFERFASLHGSHQTVEMEHTLIELETVRSPYTTLIHTDFFAENMQITPDGQLYLLDLDDGGLGDPLLDVGYFIAAGPAGVSERARTVRRVLRHEAMCVFVMTGNKTRR